MTAKTTIKTTCPYCGVGCGIEAIVDKTHRQVTIQGDITHPANYGRLCSKGSALGETLDLKTRLLNPKVLGETVTWSSALEHVAQRFNDTIQKYGSDSIAFYVSGQLLTEDYYVANKLMKGFIGSANIDTNSRLCMSSSVAGHKRAFGEDIVPNCYEDYEKADLIILIGSNTAWCHPVSFQRIRAAKEKNPQVKIVVIDPRQTASCDIADLHLPIASGSDAFLFNGLLFYLFQHHYIDTHFIEQHTEGLTALLASLSQEKQNSSQVAKDCQVSIDLVETFFHWFATIPKTLSLYSQGINQSATGTDKVNAILNCHLVTGRIGQEGSGPFSLTGQPNAMGGREVGGLANQLAAHMDFSHSADIDRVARFWQSSNIAKTAGLAAVDLFDALADKTIKAIWIMGTNPVVSLPNADKIKQALQQCDFVVVSDCIAQTDTSCYAHVLLPAQGWSEKSGTVTNSERCISRQRALLPAAGQAMPDWWIISQVAKRMGFDKAFDYDTPATIFKEHAALSAFENQGERLFNLGALAHLSTQDYEDLIPKQWPLPLTDKLNHKLNHQAPILNQRLFSDGQFCYPSKKARLIPIIAHLPQNMPNPQYPLILNTGRIRDQWHTMTRTALAAKLNQHRIEPFVEVHPDDAMLYGVTHQSLAIIESVFGKMIARVIISSNQRQGDIFIPMHWNNQFANQARVGALVNPIVDPYSYQPESKHTPVKLSPYSIQWQGFLLSRCDITLEEMAYWAKVNGEHYIRYELAGHLSIKSWQTWLSQHYLGDLSQASYQIYAHSAEGVFRLAAFIENNIELVLMIAPPQQTLPARTWLARLFSQTTLSREERLAVLSGKSPTHQQDDGNVVCACFNVGEKALKRAIEAHQLTTYQALGKQTKAGTNCGSCIPEMKQLLARAKACA